MSELSLGERLQRANWALLGLAVLLSGVGIGVVRAASQSLPTDYGAVQVRWVAVSVAACLLVLAVPYRRIVEARYVLYGLGLLLLVLVLVKGSGRSAGRWIGVGGFHLQPSELMKVVLVVMLAGYLRYERAHRSFRGLAFPFALTLVPVFLIMRQPDLGTALLLVPVLFVMLYVAGARVGHLAVLALAGLLAATAMYAIPGLMSEYQKDRIRAFLRQNDDDPLLRRKHNHQIHHSKIVVGTATAFGNGLGDDTREATSFLSERHSDFVFPVLVTAFGWAGTGVFLVLYLLLIAMLLHTAVRTREPSGRFLAVGVAALFAFQGIVNMAMTVGLLPIVGKSLPFVSFGGSGLLMAFLAIGLVLNVGAEKPMEFGRGDFV